MLFFTFTGWIPIIFANFPYARGASSVTIFPDGFNPYEHGMFDASEMIDLVKSYELSIGG